MINGKFVLSGIADECADGVAEQIAVWGELGWSHLELRNESRVTVDVMTDEHFTRVLSALRAAGIAVSALASDVGKLTLSGPKAKPFENDVAALNTLCARAKQAGCSFIRVMAYNQGDHTPDQWRDEGVRRLKILAGIAQAAGVTLALENCVGWHAESGANMRRLLEAVGSPALVCLFDTGNPSAHHGESAWDYFLQVRPLVKYVHIKDSRGPEFTMPGDGDAQIPRTLEALAADGYEGFVSIEPHLASSAHRASEAEKYGPPAESFLEYGRRLNRMILGRDKA